MLQPWLRRLKSISGRRRRMIIVVAIWIDIARFWLDRCPTHGVNQMKIVVRTRSGLHTRGVMNHHVCIENRKTFSLLHVGHDSWRYSIGAVREKSGNAVIWDDGVVSFLVRPEEAAEAHDAEGLRERSHSGEKDAGEARRHKENG